MHRKPDLINAVTFPIPFHGSETNTIFCCSWSIWFLWNIPASAAPRKFTSCEGNSPHASPPSNLPLLGGEFPRLSLISCLSYLQSVLGKNKVYLELCRVLAAFGNQRRILWSGQSQSSSFIPQIRGNSPVLFSYSRIKEVFTTINFANTCCCGKQSN